MQHTLDIHIVCFLICLESEPSEVMKVFGDWEIYQNYSATSAFVKRKSDATIIRLKDLFYPVKVVVGESTSCV